MTTVPEATKQSPDAGPRGDIEIAHMPKAGWAWRCWRCDENGFNLATEADAQTAVRQHVASAEHVDLGGKVPMPPERYHVKAKHRGEFETCWNCGRGLAICRRKIAYVSWLEADAAVQSMNESRQYADPVTRYRCRWCLLWHVTHAKSKHRAARAEKQRRKWLIARAVSS